MSTGSPLIIISGETSAFPTSGYGLQLANAVLDPTTLTGPYTFQFPNQSGTFALTSQLTGNIDGGDPSAVYVVDQLIDGGTP